MKTKNELENEMIRDEYGKGKPWAPILIIVAAYVIVGVIVFAGACEVYRVIQMIRP